MSQQFACRSLVLENGGCGSVGSMRPPEALRDFSSHCIDFSASDQYLGSPVSVHASLSMFTIWAVVATSLSQIDNSLCFMVDSFSIKSSLFQELSAFAAESMPSV